MTRPVVSTCAATPEAGWSRRPTIKHPHCYTPTHTATCPHTNAHHNKSNQEHPQTTPTNHGEQQIEMFMNHKTHKSNTTTVIATAAATATTTATATSTTSYSKNILQYILFF